MTPEVHALMSTTAVRHLMSDRTYFLDSEAIRDKQIDTYTADRTATEDAADKNHLGSLILQIYADKAATREKHKATIARAYRLAGESDIRAAIDAEGGPTPFETRCLEECWLDYFAETQTPAFGLTDALRDIVSLMHLNEMHSAEMLAQLNKEVDAIGKTP